MEVKSDVKHLNHSVFSINAHLVLVTKYRKKCIDHNVLKRLEEIFRATCEKWECELLEFGGEEDHVHLLISLNPKVQPSKFVNNLKTVSARLIRRDFEARLKKYFWKSYFWSRSYCFISCGGAPLEIIKKYIQSQENPE
jgi:putative transposase